MSRKDGGKTDASAKPADAKPATAAKGETKTPRDAASAEKPADKIKAGQAA